MRFSLLFFLLLLSVLYLSLAQGSYEDCCLTYATEVKGGIKRRVASYRRQEQDGGCNLRAIVFKLKRGRLFCARPEEKWVKDLMKKIDKTFHPRKPNSPKRGNKQGKPWN